MTLFWIVAALLALLTAGLVLLPLWRRRDTTSAQDLLSLNRRVFHERLAELEKDCREGRIDEVTFAELRTELERNLLVVNEPDAAAQHSASPRWPALVTLLLIPAAAFFFYYAWAAPQGLAQWWALKQAMGPAVDRLLRGEPLSESETAGHTLADFTRLLQDRLQRQPDDAEGWFMLGISYVQLGLPQLALTAFEHAWRLKPEESRHALALAQARLFSNEGQLDPMSRQLLRDVLATEPDHEGALVLLGFGAYRSGDYVAAVAALERLQQARDRHAGERNPEMQQKLASTLADARARLVAAGKGEVAAAAPVIRVKVRVDRALADRFAPDDVLYVFARALQGPPMPLAVAKRRAGELPLTVELDDSQSMVAQRPLSSAAELAVSARISRHGSPEPQAGDLEAVAVPVRLGKGVQNVELVIRSVR